ncbi:MAG: hypothetical protein U0163_10380 [Gemmatimonadaceae bacterium]
MAALCLIPFIGACYSFAPIEPADIQPGMGVRARISPAAGERIAPLIGTTNARILNGTLISATADTLIVEVPTAAAPDATQVGQILHQRVSIARGDVRELESRKFDRLRTGLIAGAGAAIIVAWLLKVMKNDPALEPLPGGPGSEDVIPVLMRR